MSAFAGLEHVVREQESLAPYTWMRLGGVAEYFAEPANHEELSQLLRLAKKSGIPIRLFGGGSRGLVSDVPGLFWSSRRPPGSRFPPPGGHPEAVWDHGRIQVTS